MDDRTPSATPSPAAVVDQPETLAEQNRRSLVSTAAVLDDVERLLARLDRAGLCARAFTRTS